MWDKVSLPWLPPNTIHTKEVWQNLLSGCMGRSHVVNLNWILQLPIFKSYSDSVLFLSSCIFTYSLLFVSYQLGLYLVSSLLQAPFLQLFFLVPLSLSPTSIYYFLSRTVCLSFVLAHPGGDIVGCLRVWAPDWDLTGAGSPPLCISYVTLGNRLNISVPWFNFFYGFCKIVMNW